MQKQTAKMCIAIATTGAIFGIGPWWDGLMWCLGMAMGFVVALPADGDTPCPPATAARRRTRRMGL